MKYTVLILCLLLLFCLTACVTVVDPNEEPTQTRPPEETESLPETEEGSWAETDPEETVPNEPWPDHTARY